MWAVIDGSESRVGTLHPAKARVLVKQGLARWKGKRVYLTTPEPLVTVYEDGGIKLSLTQAEMDSFQDTKDPGPHVKWDLESSTALDIDGPWPGMKVRVMKDHYQQGCVIELDSQTRMFTQLGLVHLAIPEDEWYDRVTPIDPAAEREDHYLLGDTAFWHGERFLVDGQPWNPEEHLRKEPYDSVMVHGYLRAVDLYRDQIPKHWSVVPDFEPPQTQERADQLVRGALDIAQQPCGCVDTNALEPNPEQRVACSYCDKGHVQAFNELYNLYVNGSVKLDTMLAVLGKRLTTVAKDIVKTHKERQRAWFKMDGNTRGMWVEKDGRNELLVQQALTDRATIEKITPPNPISMGSTFDGLTVEGTEGTVTGTVLKFAAPPENYLRKLETQGLIAPGTTENILTQPRCRTCGISIASEGVCTVCERRSFEALFTGYQRGQIKIETILDTLGLDTSPEMLALTEQIASEQDRLGASYHQRIATLRRIRSDLPIFKRVLGDLCGTFKLKGLPRGGFDMTLTGNESGGWSASSWIEASATHYSIYLNRFWEETPTEAERESASIITLTVTRQDQESATLKRQGECAEVLRWEPAGEKGFGEPSRRKLEYSTDDWEKTLEFELQHLRDALLDPQHAPYLIDQPELVEGLPTRFVKTADALRKAIAAAGDLTSDYTYGNVGFGFTDHDAGTRTVIYLGKFKGSQHEKPDDVGQEEWDTFTNALKTPAGRRSVFDRAPKAPD